MLKNDRMEALSEPLTPHSLPPAGPGKASSRTSRYRKKASEMAMYGNSTGVTSHRSMGIMQELQKYIAHVESLASHRKLEIEKLYEEKRDLEKLLRLPTDRPALKAPTLGELRGDEPSQVKFLLEDIRVLKDRVRKYKERSQAGDRQVSLQQNQILKLQDRVATLESSLQMANRTEVQIGDEHKLQEELMARDKEIRDLNDKLKIAQRSREADGRRHKLEAHELRKEAAGLKKEVARMAAEVEERNKEIRMDAMKIRSLRKKLDPIKRQLNQVTNPTSAMMGEENYSPTASINGPFAPPVNDGDYSLANPGLDFSAHASPRDNSEGLDSGLETGVSLTPRTMEAELRRLQQQCHAQQAKINQLRLGSGLEESQDGLEFGSRSGLESGLRASREKRELGEAEAAVTIQKALRGYAERKNFTRQKSAAMRIQAQMRGHQVRKKLRQQTLEREVNRESPTANPVEDEKGTRDGESEDGMKEDGLQEELVSGNQDGGVSARPSPTKGLQQLRQNSVTAGGPKNGVQRSPGGKGNPHGPLKSSSTSGRNSPTVKKGPGEGHHSSPSPRPKGTRG